MNNSLWAQDTTEKFVIRTYGFPSSNDYDTIFDPINNSWGIIYLPVAGCLVTSEFADSIDQLNDITYLRLENHYGKDWQERLDQELDSVYDLYKQTQENTFRVIRECNNKYFSFHAERNLSDLQTKIDIVSHQANDEKKNYINITCLQNKDSKIVYRGYSNEIELEFNSSVKELSIHLKSQGKLLLIDSCLSSNKIHFYYLTSTRSDTLFIERSNGDSIQYIFKVRNLAPPKFFLNNLSLDSTFYKKQLRNLNEISVGYEEDIIIPQKIKVENWEIVVAGKSKSYKGTGNIIPKKVSKELKKLESGTTITFLTIIKSSDCILRKKSVSFKLI